MKKTHVKENAMKELRIMCLAIIVVAGLLNTGAALFANQHPSFELGQNNPLQQALAANP